MSQSSALDTDAPVGLDESRGLIPSAHAERGRDFTTTTPAPVPVHAPGPTCHAERGCDVEPTRSRLGGCDSKVLNS